MAAWYAKPVARIADEHQQRADERVEDELDRRVDPVRAAPDPDDQVHRDEDDLPEDVEEEQVEGDEDADHPDLEDQERDHVLLDPVLDRARTRPGSRSTSASSSGRRGSSESPSTPSLYWIPKAGIQATRLDELEELAAVAPEMNPMRSSSDRTQVASAVASARPPGRSAARRDRDDERPDQRQERDERQERQRTRSTSSAARDHEVASRP